MKRTHGELRKGGGGGALGECIYLSGGFRGLLHLRWVQHVEDEGGGDEADDAGNQASQGPGAPGDGVAQGLRGQVHSQGVGCHGRDEHGRGDGAGLEAGLHDVGAHLVLGPIGRLASTRLTQRLHLSPFADFV